MSTATAQVQVTQLSDDIEYWTVAKFGNRFGLSRAYIYEDLLATGRLKSVKIGAARRIPISAVREFAASLTGGNFE